MTSREKNLLTIFVIFAMLVVGYYTVVPAFDRIQISRSQNPNLKSAVNAKEKELADVRALNNEIEQSSKRLEELSQTLPTSKDIPNLFRNLEEVARSSGMTFNSISIVSGDASVLQGGLQGQVVDTGVRTLALNVAVSGTRTQLETYLKQIEDNRRLIDVNSIVLSGLGENKTTFNLRAKTYYVD